MKSAKFILTGVILVVALLLITAEAVSGQFADTLIIKAAGLILLAVVPILWKRFRLGSDPALRRFIDRD